ncbi:hypothetical protein Taro_045219, partial [Colocasia esculenta]|nr:hypothetical protein [Colocasia esculenta]
MRASLGSLAQVQPQRLWSVAVAGCLLVPMLFLTVLRQGSQPLSIMNLQVSIVEGNGPALLAGADTALGWNRAKLLVENATVSSGKVEKPTLQAAEEASGSDVAILIQQVDGSSEQAITEGDQPTSPAEEERSSPEASDSGGRAPSSTSGLDSGSQKP